MLICLSVAANALPHEEIPSKGNGGNKEEETGELVHNLKKRN